MKYNCQILNETKAVVEVVPETDIEKSLLNQMDKDNPDQDTLGYHYGKALEIKNRYAVLLGIDSFQTFPTKAIISYDVAKGI
ncbi:hypothetical protein [Chryseobacterium viscerum]|jgi:hypothetical protein|uniref:Uncharacterized protein n=1 Tax=Chryseobacterium viscerum TaxID=1037377 RepID=A0A5N4BVW9_9FLAO|nr:hypothetical protein [Chryseobacterium viscerum]KAB1232589.1 hypothetical protein F8D52_02165 [Chryseobacterium viscerum]